MAANIQRVILPDLDFSDMPVTQTDRESLYLIAKRHLDAIASFYQVLKSHPETVNLMGRFRLRFNTVLNTWRQEYAHYLNLDFTTYQRKINKLINQAFLNNPVLQTGESLPKMLEKDGYSCLQEVFHPSFFAPNVASAFHLGLERLLSMLQRTSITLEEIHDFQSAIPQMRRLLKSVPGNVKSFKQAATTEVVCQGYTLSSLADVVGRRHRQVILPEELLEEPISPTMLSPLSPPGIVPTSPLVRDIPSPL